MVFVEANSDSLPELLQRWKTAMIAQSLRPRTISERIRVVMSIGKMSGRAPETLSTDNILAWLASKNIAITRWSYFIHLHLFFRWLCLIGRRSDDPLAAVPAPRRPTYTPRPVTQSYLDYVLARPLRYRSRVMILLAGYAGLRVHEIAKVHGRDYDPVVGFLAIGGKGGHLAVVPLHPDIRNVVQDMPRIDWWFPSPAHNGHIASRSVSSTIKQCFKRHGISMTAHQLRHSFGTGLVEAGVDIRVAQTLMRLQSISSTVLYVRVSQEQQLDALSKLSITQEGQDN